MIIIDKTRKIIKGIVRRIKITFMKKFSYTSVLDLLIPYNGVMSGTQLVVASRMIDTIRYYNNEPFYWHKKLNELVNKNKLTDSQKENMDNYYKSLLESLDKGIDYDKLKLVTSKNPFSLINGTHRLAFIALYGKKMNIPIKLIPDKSFLSMNAKTFFEDHGLTKNEMNEIIAFYNNYLQENKYELCAFIETDYVECIIHILKKHGNIGKMSNAFLNEDMIRLLRKLGYNYSMKLINKNYCFICFEPNIQRLFFDGKNIKSETISIIEKECRDKTIKAWGGILHNYHDSMIFLDKFNNIFNTHNLGDV